MDLDISSYTQRKGQRQTKVNVKTWRNVHQTFHYKKTTHINHKQKLFRSLAISVFHHPTIFYSSHMMLCKPRWMLNPCPESHITSYSPLLSEQESGVWEMPTYMRFPFVPSLTCCYLHVDIISHRCCTAQFPQCTTEIAHIIPFW